VLYEYDDEFFIQDLLTGSEEIVVNCDQSLCDAFCCIAKLEQDYQNALTLNLNTADTLYQKLVEVTIYMVLFSSALTCGRGDDATDYFNQILEISNCEPGCSCDSPDPTVIVPTCAVAAGGTTVVVAGTKITVTSNVVGDTTTYTVSIDATTSAKIDSLRNSFLVAGTGIMIVEVGLLDGSAQYTINSTVADTVYPTLNLALEVTTTNLRGTGSTPIYGATLVNPSDVMTVLYEDTSKFTTPVTHDYENVATADGTQSFAAIASITNDDNIYIRVTDFLDTTTDVFSYNVSVSVKGVYDSVTQVPIEAVGHYQEDDVLIFKLNDTRTGNLLQWYDLLQMLDPAQTLYFEIAIHVQA
jgi:hypothetical protein